MWLPENTLINISFPKKQKELNDRGFKAKAGSKLVHNWMPWLIFESMSVTADDSNR